jgi:hypothetical protein
MQHLIIYLLQVYHATDNYATDNSLFSFFLGRGDFRDTHKEGGPLVNMYKMVEGPHKFSVEPPHGGHPHPPQRIKQLK